MTDTTTSGESRLLSPNEFEQSVLKTDVFLQAKSLLKKVNGPLDIWLTSDLVTETMKRKRWWQFPALRRSMDPRLIITGAVIKSWQKHLAKLAPAGRRDISCRYLVTIDAMTLRVDSAFTGATHSETLLCLETVDRLLSRFCPWIDDLTGEVVFLSYCEFLINGE